MCEMPQRRSCKAFTGLSIRAKMVGGGRPCLTEILIETDPSPSKTSISNRYSLVASQA